MYRFRMEALLNHRRHQEEICQKKLAQTERLLSAEQEKLRRMVEEKDENEQKLQTRQKDHINVSAVILSLNYIRALSQSIEKQSWTGHSP